MAHGLDFTKGDDGQLAIWRIGDKGPYNFAKTLLPAYYCANDRLLNC